MVVITLEPGEVGWSLDEATGTIMRVDDTGQAQARGVLRGWTAQLIDEYPYSYDCYLQREGGASPYTIAFKKHSLQPMRGMRVSVTTDFQKLSWETKVSLRDGARGRKGA